MTGDPPKTVPKGRLAPSPTGGLHLGHARTFLAAWLSARSRGGKVVLRVEDLDASRVRGDATSGAIVDLRWLGLDWDEGPDVGGPSAPYFQTERLDQYEAALARLKAMGSVYPCSCTRSEIARVASAPHAEDEGPTYPGTCAGRSVADASRLGGTSFAWRFRVPPAAVPWDDTFLGRVAIDPSKIGGDFIVARNGHGPAYQLAVVADDAAMGVTEVIRGRDLVPSTPRQILLYRAFGWPVPTFGHLPLAEGADGRRLAKRDGALRLATLREGGTDPKRIIGWLAASLGMAESVEPTRPADWLSRYDAAKVPSGPCVIDPAEWQRADRIDAQGAGAAAPSFE